MLRLDHFCLCDLRSNRISALRRLRFLRVQRSIVFRVFLRLLYATSRLVVIREVASTCVTTNCFAVAMSGCEIYDYYIIRQGYTRSTLLLGIQL